MFDFASLSINQEELLSVKEKAKKLPSTEMPDGVDIRLTRKGKLTPSKAFAEKWRLEFPNKDLEDQGFALDIVWSKELAGYPKDAPECHFIGIIRRGEPKASAFASTRSYAENGDPKSSVLSGTVNDSTISFAEQLFTYIDISEDSEYVDLQVLVEHDLAESTNGEMMIPKIPRGKTTISNYHRKSIKLFPVVLSSQEIETLLENQVEDELSTESDLTVESEAKSLIEDVIVFESNSEEAKEITDSVNVHNTAIDSGGVSVDESPEAPSSSLDDLMSRI